MQKSLARADRAALFFMLAKDDRLTSSMKFDEEIEKILLEWGTSLKSLDELAGAERFESLKRMRLCAHKSLAPFLDALEHNQHLKSFNAEVEVFFKLKLPAIVLDGDIPFNFLTFATGERAFTGNIFDPMDHARVFGDIEEVIHRNRKYTEFEPHCFAVN